MVMVLPVVESRATIVRTTRMVIADLVGLGAKRKAYPAVVTEGVAGTGASTPPDEKNITEIKL